MLKKTFCWQKEQKQNWKAANRNQLSKLLPLKILESSWVFPSCSNQHVFCQLQQEEILQSHQEAPARPKSSVLGTRIFTWVSPSQGSCCAQTWTQWETVHQDGLTDSRAFQYPLDGKRCRSVLQASLQAKLSHRH